MTAPLIVVVAPSLRSGSVAAVAWRHAIELARTHRVAVMSREEPPAGHPEIERIVVRPRSWKILRRFAHVPNELAFALAVRGGLETLATRERIALVWCHSHASVALAAAPLKRRLGFAVVMTSHGDIFDRPAGTYARELTWFYRAVTRPAYRNSDIVHALSPYMRDRAIAGGARAVNVRVIPNGIEASELGMDRPSARDSTSFMRDGLHVLYVGSLWSVKGVGVLLRAAAQFMAAGTCGLRLTIVGTGLEHGALTRLVRQLGMERQVTFAGQVPRPELGPFYAQADVLCIPSRSEAFPTVALEAMLCALPIIGSDTGGIPSLVEHGRSGWLVPPGDVEALDGCFREAAASPERLAAFGAAGLAKVQRQFTWTEVSAQLDALTNEIIGASAPGAAHGQPA